MMPTIQTTDTLYGLLAHTLEYPTPALRDQVLACEGMLKGQHRRAAHHMARFRAFVEQTAPERLEELYTATFDLRPVCYPYIGYQLFGESYKRGEFMALLSSRYRQAGFETSGELPDCLSVILRYLAQTPDADLVTEGVVPALERMVEQLQGNPYRELLQAILAVLQG